MFFLVAFFFLSANHASAQINNSKKVLERKVTNKANQAINKEADKAVDSAFKAKKKPNEPKKETNPAKDTTVLPSSGSEPSL